MLASELEDAAMRDHFVSQLPAAIGYALLHPSNDSPGAGEPFRSSASGARSRSEEEHPLRVVWKVLGETISPGEILHLKSHLPSDVVERLDRFEREASEEEEEIVSALNDTRMERDGKSSSSAAAVSLGDFDTRWYFAEEAVDETGEPTSLLGLAEPSAAGLGVSYRDGEPLEPGEHRNLDRWELDPASAEDYRRRPVSARRPRRIDH